MEGGGANGYNKVVKTYFQIHVAGEQLHIYMKQISKWYLFLSTKRASIQKEIKDIYGIYFNSSKKFF